MKRGPKAGGSAVHESYAAKAAVGWKGAAPDWVMELAACADERGAKQAAELIGYSQATLSNVLNGKQENHDIERIEQATRGALMGLRVECAVKGDIGRDLCLITQRQPFSAHRPDRVIQYHACRGGCAHFAKTGGDDART